MAKNFQMRICQKQNNFPKKFQIQKFIYFGDVTSFPPSIKHCPQCSFLSWNRIGWDFRKSPSNSQVASSGLKFFHCTFTWAMAMFRSVTSLQSRMRRGSTWNSPSGSTYTKFQSIIWVGSWIYFFNKETWNTLWILRSAGSASWYATGPIRASISKGPQNLGASVA